MENKVAIARNDSIDIVKGVLIFLVVLAHFAVSKSLALPIRAWGNAIYSFHMPAFIFISGFLSKRVSTQRIKEIDLLLWPFIVFQVLNYIYTRLTGFGVGSLNIFKPAYLNWYILALFFWRTFLPYFDKIKPSIALSIAFILAFVSGFFVDNDTLTLYRVFYFFPVFLIGYYTDDIKASVIKVFKNMYIGLAIFLLGFVLITFLSVQSEDSCSLIHKAFAPDYGYDSIISACVSGGGYIASLSMTYAFFSFCFILEKHLKFLKSLGKNSMACYITHGFFTLALVPMVISRCDALVGSVLSFLFACILCWLLTREKFVTLLSPLLDFKAFCRLFHVTIYRKD